MKSSFSRRQFLKTGSLSAAALTMASGAVKAVHAGENNTIKVAWVGCGNRGAGAVRQALRADSNIQLYAAADAFEDKVNAMVDALADDSDFEGKVNCPEERRFFGMDAYKKAIDSLDDGDIVLLTTPPAFRPLHYCYAVDSPKMINVFAEKPVATDIPNLKMIREANERAMKKGIKVGVGLNNRNYLRTEETVKAVQDGIIGDVNCCWVYRYHGPHNLSPIGNWTPLQHQLRNIFCFDWTSGGFIVDALIHNVDIACWASGEYPIAAQGSGGRTHREVKDQLIDLASVEYIFPSGKRLMLQTRTMPNTWSNFCCCIQGSKGTAHLGEGVGEPACYKGYEGLPFSNTRQDAFWTAQQPANNSYQEEHNRLFKAIREDRAWNEMERGIMATFTTILGRMATETGQYLFADQVWESQFRYDSKIRYADLTFDGESVDMPDENGDYPIPHPGVTEFI